MGKSGAKKKFSSVEDEKAIKCLEKVDRHKTMKMSVE